MLAGQADMAIAYQPSVASAVDQGAKVVFDFSNYVGPFCNTGIMVLPSTIERDPEMVQALVTSFEEASRLTYSDPAFAKKVARLEFPDLPGEVVDAAIDAELQYLIPAQSVVTQADQWKNLMDMQIYLGNVKGSIPMAEIIDNSFAEKAVKELGGKGRNNRDAADTRSSGIGRDGRRPAGGGGIRRWSPFESEQGLRRGWRQVPVIADLSFTLEAGDDRQHRRAVGLRQDHAPQSSCPA